jgi:hypothetical protein
VEYIDFLIGQKGTYPWDYNLRSPFAYYRYYQSKEDIVLITRYFIVWKGFFPTEERIVNEVMVELFHESLHEAIWKSIGENEASSYDDKYSELNRKIEEHLGWDALPRCLVQKLS